MSLKVWMPMTNDLRNQGLSNVTVTTSGTVTSSTGGKIGSCYNISSGSMISLSPSFINNFYECTFALWIYINSFGSSYDTVFQAGLGTAPWASYIFGLLRNNATSKFTFVIGDTNTSTGSNLKTSTDFATQQWYHIAGTYKDKKLKLYVNGQLEDEITTSMIPAFDKVRYFTIGKINNGNYPCNIKLNDFRIYDNALSAREIKEISKGLVLHYPLNQQNRSKNLLPSTSRNEVTGTRVSSNYKDFLIYSNIVTPDINEVITVSFYAKSTIKNSSLTVYLYNNSTGRQVSSAISNIGTTSSSPDGGISLPIPKNFTKYWIQYTFNSNETALIKTLLFRLLAGSDGAQITIKNIKLERGKNNNPIWTDPNENVLIEYDTSGYNYNGDTTANTAPITVGTSSPRYNLNTKFDTAEKYIQINNFNSTGFQNSYSISWWEKLPDYSGAMSWGSTNGNRLNVYYYNGYIYCNTADGASNPFLNGTAKVPVPTVDTWTYMTFVGDGTDCKLYINGELAGTASFRALTASTITLHGWDTGTNYSPANAELSDFRIYSTVLSASDIIELYNTGTIVNKNASIMSYEFIEE